MDGKLLILCDELPGDYKDYTVKDKNYLVSPMKAPEDEPERLFVCWDSVIPEDRAFIEACKYYARFTEMPDSKFAFLQRGAADLRGGTIKGSVQEGCYLETYTALLDYLREVKKSGGDLYGEILEKAVQFPFDANERFYQEFSRLLNMNGVVRILPTYSTKTHKPTTNYRALTLDAWKNSNSFMPANRKSGAQVLTPLVYSDFGDVYKRSIDEMMKIYSLPIFGESDDEPEGPDF